MTPRSIARTLPAVRVTEGGGFLVYRPFPTRSLMDVDPFLMLDELGPVEYGPGEAIGAPDHPHRGFEIISYNLRGESLHSDSFGHRGTMSAGDAQYMLAGAGVVHREMPAETILRDGGAVHGLQLWINLPRADKALRPRYVDVRAASIPVFASADGAFRAKIIAGEAFGVRGRIETRHPTDYAHVTIAPQSRAEIPLRPETTALAYVLDGTVHASATRAAGAHELVIYAAGGDGIVLENRTDVPAEIIVLAAAPIGEPTARYGPFVMTTDDEIAAAFEDYRSGKMGTIAPERTTV